MPTVAQIMASRSAHTEEREERRWRERLHEREGNGRGVTKVGAAKRSRLHVLLRERKRILKKGREEQTEIMRKEKGETREQWTHEEAGE